MLVHLKNEAIQKRLEFILIFKASIFLILGVSLRDFLFVAIDSIVTYLFFCGVLGYVLYKKGILEMRYICYGVLICLPSAFIFILQKQKIHTFERTEKWFKCIISCSAFTIYIGSFNLALQCSALVGCYTSSYGVFSVRLYNLYFTPIIKINFRLYCRSSI